MVAVSEIVTTNAVSTPFFLTVNVHDFPVPGAVESKNSKLLIFPAQGISVSASASVP